MVFAIYLIVTMTLTIIHMVAEYNNTQERIVRELESLETIFQPGLSQSLWNIDTNQLEANLQGIMNIPIIVGVKLDGFSKKQHKARGWIITKDGTPFLIEAPGKSLPNKPHLFFRLFLHEFKVTYIDKNFREVVGTATFYSSNEIIVNQIKYSFIFIIVNAVIKTLALWIIFFVVSRILLTRPLSVLIQCAEQINLDNLEHIQIKLKNRGHNELNVLEKAMNTMVQNLLHARTELQNLNQSLEQKVQERTHKLQKKTEELSQKNIANMELIEDNNIQNEKFSKVFHSAPYAIAITELYEGKFLEVNDSYVNMSGYKRSELIGKTGVELKLLTKEIREVIVRKLLEGEKIDKMEGQMRKKSGEILMIIGSAQLINIRNKLYIIGSQADITDLKMAHQSRLNAMSELISTIAHQWRQPLATLGMMVQRTHAVGKINRISQEYIEEFKTNAMGQIKYMSDTIDIFRGFYRPEKQKAPFSPLSCINDCVKLLEPQFIKSVIKISIISSDYDGQLVNGFSSEFKQVILNLLGNSRDAIIERFGTENTTDKEGYINIQLTTNTQDKSIIIDLSDNGCGIPDEVASKIFIPYFTTKEANGGTGIGLYMSRMIVQESLNGSLSIIKSNEGSTFRITFPLEEELYESE